MHIGWRWIVTVAPLQSAGAGDRFIAQRIDKRISGCCRQHKVWSLVAGAWNRQTQLGTPRWAKRRLNSFQFRQPILEAFDVLLLGLVEHIDERRAALRNAGHLSVS